MRASKLLIWTLVLLSASPALARDRKKKTPEPTQEEAAPAAEPAEEDTGWGSAMMDDIRGKKKAETKPAKKGKKVAEREPEPEPEPEPAEEAPAEEAPVEEEQTKKEPEPEAEPAPDEATPTTPPTWWFGAQLNDTFVPSFMLSMFLDEPPSIGNLGFGVTATHRSADGLSLVLGLGYVGYGFEGTLRAIDDPEEDTEWVTSKLGFVHVTGAILWSMDFGQMFAFEYGLGLDVGIVTGDLTRSEAVRVVPGGAFSECIGPRNPGTLAPSGKPYCEFPSTNGVLDPTKATNTADELGEQYHVKSTSIPPVMAFPALPQLALRFSPHRNIAIKLEAAYGIFQFKVGVSAAYGLDI